ncbi:MAG: carotenoid oxygenase family protein [Haliscomenobacter sp.]|uniref:carotenoid oxygenase family protein n=1 Tax=Haliscomenobacter sp. TaxID=2717303 RepID=UPI0029AF661D|nr:carotenoid oxygenase family protein [Haliscomenobacter sp.]MDX2072155.1 carotenoid oxygenase family protein [Haliscomenobacter sp.]
MRPQPNLTTSSITQASRTEYTDQPLFLIEGVLPQDLSGAVYFSSPVGTVESDGLPYPSGQEDSSPVFNGDGMILKVDFSTPGEVYISAKILKTPCYYADEVVSTVPEEDEKYAKGFFNVGISRLSTYLGVRNQLNTAMIPLRLPGEDVDRILATFDTGRPYEFDPNSLQLLHPMGNNLKWKAQFFPFVEYIFPMIATTAHPAYDPNSGDFFTVNYTKSLLNMAFPPKQSIRNDQIETFFQNMNRVLDEFLDSWNNVESERNVKEETQLIDQLEKDVTRQIKELSAQEEMPNEEEKEAFSLQQNAVFIVKRDQQGSIRSWRVKDIQGDDIRIAESIHQTGITEDYFVFIDSSFKISMDLLVPYFRKPWTVICQFLRGFFQTRLKDYTHIYVVKRSDLNENTREVTAERLTIADQMVHFAIDYRNPDRTITLHTAHNSSLCAAEWVRRYDKLAIDPDLELDPHVVGLPTIGEMDVSKIGRIKIKVTSKKDEPIRAMLKQSKLIYETLELSDLQNRREDLQNLGPNTWGIGLFTYLDYLAPGKIVEKVPYIFWQMYGLDYQILTQYIYNLYDLETNVVPPEDVLAYTREGIPFSIVRQNTRNMKLEDWYYFPDDHYLRSLQFVPKNSPLPANLEKELHGYLICTVIVQKAPKDPYSFSREIWIFDSAALNTGPVSKLTHPSLSFAFTIHSAWLPTPQSVNPAWAYDVREDYDQVLRTFRDTKYAAEIREFMESNVYPNLKV